MPIGFDLESYREKFDCVNYFETGLWDARDDVSLKKALKSNFEKVFCIELRKDWVDLGKDIFRDEISSGRCSIFNDDSINLSKYLNDDCFSKKTMFFLDAHVDNENIKNYVLKCPLLEELTAISTLKRKDNIILIDDLRIINTTYPWEEQTYGQINFLDKIIESILRINPEYQFTTLDGIIENDVLMCYV